MTGSLDVVDRAICAWLAGSGDNRLVLGLCGAQGSGKSTLAEGLAKRMTGRGIRAAILSLDDLYLSGAERARLAREIHPLLQTRGVPLTHDVGLGERLLADVRAGLPVRLPRFDKAADEPVPQSLWEAVPTTIDLLIFEGWCVGARPQDEAELSTPVNALERDRDPDGRWRRAVNAALGGAYARLFAQIDRLVLLAAPSFDIVRVWRTQQEESLRRTMVGRDTSRLMSAADIALFVQHYERITRAILSEMPARADLVLPLDSKRQPEKKSLS